MCPCLQGLRQAQYTHTHTHPTSPCALLHRRTLKTRTAMACETQITAALLCCSKRSTSVQLKIAAPTRRPWYKKHSSRQRVPSCVCVCVSVSVSVCLCLCVCVYTIKEQMLLLSFRLLMRVCPPCPQLLSPPSPPSSSSLLLLLRGTTHSNATQQLEGRNDTGSNTGATDQSLEELVQGACADWGGC